MTPDEDPKQEDVDPKVKDGEDEEPEQEPFPESPVPAERVRIWEGADRKLCVEVDTGKETEATFEGLTARRIFPLSGKADYISMQGRTDKEKVLLARPAKLDKKSRHALEPALARMSYVAKIERIDSIEETWGVSHWHVQTDRGYASFEVVDRSKIRKIGQGRLVITDADGNRFEVEDVDQLDEKSQALVFSET